MMNGKIEHYHTDEINLGRPLIAGSNLWQDFLLNQAQAAGRQNPPRQNPPPPTGPGNLIGAANEVPQFGVHGAMAFPLEQGHAAGHAGQQGQIELNPGSFAGAIQMYRDNPEEIIKKFYLYKMMQVSTKVTYGIYKHLI